ncbi:MAG TPA: ComEA family DNA-binding protein [Microbacteriaceae bacterium]|nr:ComEA family DNA-binding protein [Microbacteriaceae bacterium]
MEAEPRVDELDGLAPGARAGPHGVRIRIGVGAGIVLLIAALIVAVIVSVLAPHGSTQTVAAVTGKPGSASGGLASADPGARAGVGASAPIFVHVLGAVAHPGLFELRDGARVIDAIAAAGGFSADAEKGGVNLARVVADGEQLHVPRVGEVIAGGSVAGAAPGGASGGGASGFGGKVNLNVATVAELDALPRVGPVMAQRIVDWRTANGRFTSVDDLRSVTGIGQKTFDGLKDLVTI